MSLVGFKPPPQGPTYKAKAANAVWSPVKTEPDVSMPKETKETNQLKYQDESSPVWQPFGAFPEDKPQFRTVKLEIEKNKNDQEVLVKSEEITNRMTQKIESQNANNNITNPSNQVSPRCLTGLSNKLPQSQSPTVTLLQKAREGQIPKGALYIKVNEEENVSGQNVPIKYEGIGPTVQGIPLSLRTEIKEEYASDWYKTMYKSLHKFDNPPDDYFTVKYFKKGNVPHADGYMSEPEIGKDYTVKYSKNKYAKTLEIINGNNEIESKNIYLPTSLHSNQEIYKNQPRSITEYEPGHSSISDREERIQKSKYLPPLNQPKPSYIYRDGYESDSTLFRRTGKPSSLDPLQQKLWYRKIQQGSDIPFSGLGKPAPERPKKMCSCSLCVQRHLLQFSRSPCQSLDSFNIANPEKLTNTNAQSMLANKFSSSANSDHMLVNFNENGSLRKSFPIPPCRNSSLWNPLLQSTSKYIKSKRDKNLKHNAKHNYSTFIFKERNYNSSTFSNKFAKDIKFINNTSLPPNDFHLSFEPYSKTHLSNSEHFLIKTDDDISSQNSKHISEQEDFSPVNSDYIFKSYNSSNFINPIDKPFKVNSSNTLIHCNLKNNFHDYNKSKYHMNLNSEVINQEPKIFRNHYVISSGNDIRTDDSLKNKKLYTTKENFMEINSRTFLRNLNEITNFTNEDIKNNEYLHYSICLKYNQYINNVIESVNRSQKFLRLKNYYCSLEEITKLESERNHGRYLSYPIVLQYLYAKLKTGRERGECFFPLKKEINWNKRNEKGLKMKTLSIEYLRQIFENNEQTKFKQTIPNVYHRNLNKLSYSLSVSDLIYKYNNFENELQCKKLKKNYFGFSCFLSSPYFREKINSVRSVFSELDHSEHIQFDNFSSFKNKANHKVKAIYGPIPYYHFKNSLITSIKNFKSLKEKNISDTSENSNKSFTKTYNSKYCSTEYKSIAKEIFKTDTFKSNLKNSESLMNLNPVSKMESLSVILPYSSISSEKESNKRHASVSLGNHSSILINSQPKTFISVVQEQNISDIPIVNSSINLNKNIKNRNFQLKDVVYKYRKDSEFLIGNTVKDKIKYFEKMAHKKCISLECNYNFNQILMHSKLIKNYTKSSSDLSSLNSLYSTSPSSSHSLTQNTHQNNFRHLDLLSEKRKNIENCVVNENFLKKISQNKINDDRIKQSLLVLHLPRRIVSCCDIRDYSLPSNKSYTDYNCFQPNYIPERTVSSIDLRHSLIEESFQTINKKSKNDDCYSEETLINDSKHEILNKNSSSIIVQSIKNDLENRKVLTGKVQRIKVLFENRRSYSVPDKIKLYPSSNTDDYGNYKKYINRNISSGSVKQLCHKFECMENIVVTGRCQQNSLENKIQLHNNTYKSRNMFQDLHSLNFKMRNFHSEDSVNPFSEIITKKNQNKNKTILKKRTINSYKFYDKIFPLSFTKYLINKSERRKVLQKIIRKFEILHHKNKILNNIYPKSSTFINKKCISMWIRKDSNDYSKSVNKSVIYQPTRFYKKPEDIENSALLKKSLTSTSKKSSNIVSTLLPHLISTSVSLPHIVKTTSSYSPVIQTDFFHEGFSRYLKNSGRENKEDLITSRDEKYVPVCSNSLLLKNPSFKSKEHENICYSVSPHKYQETEVNIHYRSPIHNLEKEYIEEEELRKRQEEAMKKFYEEEKYKKYLQQLAEIEMRRHNDFFIPSQKSPIPLNRYDNPFELTTSPPKTLETRTMARVLFNFTAQTSRELSLDKGNVVYILRKIDENWYEGEYHGMIGIFPVNYVEIIPQENANLQPRRVTEGLAKVKFNFRAKTPLELSLFKGEKVVLMRQVDSNWYEGRIGNKKGIFPLSYIEIIKEPGEIVASSMSPKPASKSVFDTFVNRIPTSQQENFSPNDSYLEDFKLNSTNKQFIQEKTQPLTQSLHIDTTNEPIPYRVLYNYKPQNEDELELQEQDTVYVLEKCDDGWYVGTSLRTGLFGTFPGNYVERI